MNRIPAPRNLRGDQRRFRVRNANDAPQQKASTASAQVIAQRKPMRGNTRGTFRGIHNQRSADEETTTPAATVIFWLSGGSDTSYSRAIIPPFRFDTIRDTGSWHRTNSLPSPVRFGNGLLGGRSFSSDIKAPHKGASAPEDTLFRTPAYGYVDARPKNVKSFRAHC